MVCTIYSMPMLCVSLYFCLVILFTYANATRLLYASMVVSITYAEDLRPLSLLYALADAMRCLLFLVSLTSI